MRMAYYYDQSRCMGCNSCTVSCKDYYNVNPGKVRYRKQFTHERDDGAGGFYAFAMSCNHCEKPACVEACGAGAITKREDGVVLVDRTKCEDLQACILACPFAAPAIADDRQEPETQAEWKVRHPMQKCNMCAEILDAGEKPVCIRACPNHALDMGDYEELRRQYPEALPLTVEKFPYAYLNHEDATTGPNMLIKPRRPLKIKGNYK